MKSAKITLPVLVLCSVLTGWAAQGVAQHDQQAGAQQSDQQSMPKDMQMPGDMRPAGGQQANPAAARESESMRNSEAQQKPQVGATPGQGSDAQSLTHPTMTLQEPENPEHHTGEQHAGENQTGENLPAPDLLGEVARRAPLALGEFETWAEKLNPTLAEAQQAVRRSEQQGRQAGLYPNPTIAYDGEHIRGGSYGSGEEGGYVQQQIVLGGKLRLRRDIYEQQAAVNRIGVEEQGYRVRAAVQAAFYRALASQAEVGVRQRLLRVTEDAVETVHQLANVGQADAPDILQSEVEAEQARVDLVRAQRQFLQDFRVLAAVANKPDLPASPLSGELEKLPEMDATQQVSAIVSNSPEVKRAEQQVHVAEARLRDGRREPVPDLMLRAGEWRSGEFTEGTQRAAGAMSFASAGIELPLWNRNQGNVEAAKAELERAREDATRTRLLLRQEAEPLAQQYASARFEAERYRTEMIPRAQRAYELYQMKYRQMGAAYPQVLVSQRTLFQLQIGYLHALAAAWESSIALENYALSGGLEAPRDTGAESTTTTINLPGGGGSE